MTYYLSVTCVSRSGVESYKCTETADMSSSLVPQGVAGLTVTATSGGKLHLSWTAVTHLENGNPITTPLTYVIHRASTAGFTPDDGNRLSTVSASTQYDDSTMSDCSVSYYQVCAKACGNEGNPSPEASGNHPAPPSARRAWRPPLPSTRGRSP